MSYYDIVIATYNRNFTARIDSELIEGGYKDKNLACNRARMLAWTSEPSEFGENKNYEVEQHNEDSGSLECIFSLN